MFIAFAGLAHAVALDRLGQDQRRLPLVFDGALVGAEDLEDVVATPVQPPDLIVGPVGDEFLEFRGVEEMLADIGTVLGLEGLVLAVHRLHHPLSEDALLVAQEQRVPLGSPDQLDDVPAGAAESPLEFLDDLAVAAHRTIEALQVAVDHENQVVEPLARGHADGAQRFDLIGLAVAEEGPDLAVAGLDETAAVQVFHEARLIDRLDRAEAHRNRRELPEIGHQPRMRVGRDALAVDFLAETVHLFVGQPAEQVRARIDAGNRMPLEEDQVAAVLFRRRVPEPRETDIVERRRRSEGSDMAPDIAVPVGANDHRHGVPADVVMNPDFQVGIAGILRLLVDRNGVDVFGGGTVRKVDSLLARLCNQAFDQEVGALGALSVDDAAQGVLPFLGLLRVRIVHAGRRRVCGQICHDLSPDLENRELDGLLCCRPG
jgi:hypothetical protein